MHSGKLNGGAYVEITEDALPLFIENTFGSSNQNWMFMHNNAPLHRSRYTLKWFENKGIRVIKWLAMSPELNPIENRWDFIEKTSKKNEANRC